MGFFGSLGSRLGLTAVVDANTAKYEAKMDRVGKKAQNTGNAIRAGLKIGAVAFAGLATAATLSVKAFIDQEKQESKLKTVLEATGNAAGFVAEELIAEASALQSLAGVSDSAIIGMQSILATFKEIKGPVFKDAERAIIAMSYVLEQDLKQGAIQVGKALNDPIIGITALQRSGVSFTQDQKKLIKQMVLSGDVMGAQKIILRELKSEFGDAGAASKTFGGRLKIAYLAGSDLLEFIGKGLSPSLDRLSTKFSHFVNNVDTAKLEDIGRFMGDLAEGATMAAEAIGPLVWVFEKMIEIQQKRFEERGRFLDLFELGYGQRQEDTRAEKLNRIQELRGYRKSLIEEEITAGTSPETITKDIQSSTPTLENTKKIQELGAEIRELTRTLQSNKATMRFDGAASPRGTY